MARRGTSSRFRGPRRPSRCGFSCPAARRSLLCVASRRPRRCRRAFPPRAGAPGAPIRPESRPSGPVASLPREVPMLQVRNVRKVYDGRTVVNDVSFDVAAGEIFALLGPNGAGKTTLIRMITDIVRPDAGTITFDGEAVTGPKRPRMAYLPEERGLYKKVPVLDALAYFGELKGLSAA